MKKNQSDIAKFLDFILFILIVCSIYFFVNIFFKMILSIFNL